MRWSFRIARISGIEVKIHVTFLLLLAWFAWMDWQAGGLAAAGQGTVFILLLFLCVLLHEFGHAFAARMYGIRTPDITLLPIGGVARLERMPEKPSQELVVAVAGPAVNVVIALFLFLAMAAKFSFSDLTGTDLVSRLMAVNVMLIAFNAIPAFPMDGGRVLRALLAMRFSFVTATTVAARVGQVIAVLFFAASFYGSPMLGFIGVFVFMGAQQELAYAQFRAQVQGRRVTDLMRSDFVTLPAEASCRDAAGIVRRSAQSVFPVVSRELKVVGAASGDEIEANAESSAPVASLARPVVRAAAAMPVEVFLQIYPPGTVAVVENASGEIVGVVDPEAGSVR